MKFFKHKLEESISENHESWKFNNKHVKVCIERIKTSGSWTCYGRVRVGAAAFEFLSNEATAKEAVKHLEEQVRETARLFDGLRYCSVRSIIDFAQEIVRSLLLKCKFF